MYLRSDDSFHPVDLYSTERLFFWNLGYPFLPGILALQLSKNLLIAKATRSAAACASQSSSTCPQSQIRLQLPQYICLGHMA